MTGKEQDLRPVAAEAVAVPLPQDSSAPAVARRAARSVLDRWQLTAVLEPVLLVVSELVTNALRHGRPPVGLDLVRHGDSVTVDVHDTSPLPAAPGLPADDDAESGRGLSIVAAVADSSGCRSVPADGKTVWARIDVPTADLPARDSPTDDSPTGGSPTGGSPTGAGSGRGSAAPLG